MKDVLEAAGKSIWKEVRELALKKGTETLVAEGIKSVLEVAKRRRIRRDEYEFAEWKKSQKTDADDAKRTAAKQAAAKRTADADAKSKEPPEEAKADADASEEDDAADEDDDETPDDDEPAPEDDDSEE